MGVAVVGPQTPAREPREIGGKGGRKWGNSLCTEELWAGEGSGAAAPGVVDMCIYTWALQVVGCKVTHFKYGAQWASATHLCIGTRTK